MKLRFKKIVLMTGALLVFAPHLAWGDIIVKGKVRNAKGEPLPGVAILLKGTSTGTITDADGYFTLPTSTHQGVLVISYIGYRREEKNAAETMEIVLQEDVQTLGEVVVTTQKRAQTSIEVPVAVSALSGNSLKRMNLQQMDEMAQFIPGLQVQIQSPNNPGYVIRGVTSDDGASYSQPRISVFQDGVSISRSRASVVELFDLERVEVVKGPQGTLFGRGAEIGGIHIIRNKPTDYLGGEIALNYGSHNQRGATGFINTPIIKERLANRFAFSYDAHDGFIENLSGGDLNGKSALAFRNSTRLFAGENTTFNLILDYQHDDYPGTSFKSKRLAPIGGDTDPFTAAGLERGKDLGIKRDVGGVTFLADHTLNENWKLSSITGFRAFKSNENFDADGTYLPLLDCEENAKGTQFSQEFRLNFDNKSRFSGFVGASYFYENSSQEAVVRSNLQNLYPAYAYQGFAAQVKPQFDQLSTQLPGMFPEAMRPMVEQMIAGLMGKWFPESYDLTTNNTLTTTPDFYGDVKNTLAAYGMSLDDLLAGMGEQGQVLLQTLKGASAMPLNSGHEENSTNYGTNQAAEIFADATLKLAKGWSLTAGIRGSYEHQKTGYSSTTVADPVFGAILYKPSLNRVNASDNYFSWVGRVALNYMFKRNNAYISVSRGRRPGVIAFNNDPQDISKLKPEIIVSYEAGLKGSILDNRLNYDLSIYYYDWTHFQTTRLDEREGSVGKIYIADDAGKAHSFGVEAGLRYAPTRYISVFGNYSYIDGKFNDKDENGVEQEYAGNRFRLTPMNTFSVGLDVNIPVNKSAQVYVRPSYSYKSRVYFEDNNDPALTQEGYGLANFNAGIRFQPKNVYYEISAFGKNVFNEKYIVDAGNSGNQINFPTFVAGSPSVFGIQVKVGF